MVLMLFSLLITAAPLAMQRNGLALISETTSVARIRLEVGHAERQWPLGKAVDTSAAQDIAIGHLRLPGVVAETTGTTCGTTAPRLPSSLALAANTAPPLPT